MKEVVSHPTEKMLELILDEFQAFLIGLGLLLIFVHC